MNHVKSLTVTLVGSFIVGVTGCSSPSVQTISPSPESTVSPVVMSADSQSQQTQPQPQPIQLTVEPENPDPIVSASIQKYLVGLNVPSTQQGVWIQTEDQLLANHQGTTPLPAASLTKVATTLAVLDTYGVDYRFITEIGTNGTIKNGVLQGDLIVKNGDNPMFVWEDAIAVGNALNQLGIKQVTGNLIIVGKFMMNFEESSQLSAALFQEGINAQTWSAAVEDQYFTLPQNTPRPEVSIGGDIKQVSSLPETFKPLLTHASLPLAELAKKMNQYSNNPMSEMLANTVGGAKVVAQKAATLAQVNPQEIQLINGSGLGVENRISPRAAVAMFRALEQLLKPHQMTVANLFSIVGQDEGVLAERQLPKLSIVKSGTLDEVSALAGVIATENKGRIWFTIINGGTDIEGFRIQQETLLKGFLNQWGAVKSLPTELQPNVGRKQQAVKVEIVQ